MKTKATIHLCRDCIFDHSNCAVREEELEYFDDNVIECWEYISIDEGK